MWRSSFLMHLGIGAVTADLVALGGALWLRHQYTIGVDLGFGLLALIAVAFMGAAIGYALFKIRRAA